MNRKTAIAAVLVLALSACASMRSMKVESDDGSSYTIDVRNNRSSMITVSYSDGTTTRELGSVNPGRTEHFVVVSGDGRITVYARTAGGANLPGQTVTLGSGSTMVTIR